MAWYWRAAPPRLHERRPQLMPLCLSDSLKTARRSYTGKISSEDFLHSLKLLSSARHNGAAVRQRRRATVQHRGTLQHMDWTGCLCPCSSCFFFFSNCFPLSLYLRGVSSALFLPHWSEDGTHCAGAIHPPSLFNPDWSRHSVIEAEVELAGRMVAD